jgi:hypothetical protein
VNKNLKAALIVGGVAVGLLAVAFVAKAAGFTGNVASLPYGRQMLNSANAGWQGHMLGAMGANFGRGMMGGGFGPGMLGAQGGRMMDFDNMPHRNWAAAEGEAPWEDCPYFNEGE